MRWLVFCVLCLAINVNAITPNEGLTQRIQNLLKNKNTLILKGHSPETNQACFLAVRSTSLHGERVSHVVIGEGAPPRVSAQATGFDTHSKFVVEANWANRNGSPHVKFGVSRFDVSEEHLFLERYSLVTGSDRVWRWETSQIELEMLKNHPVQAVGKQGLRQIRCQLAP